MAEEAVTNDRLASLEEFSGIPGVPSVVTLRKLIKDCPEFPTVVTGRPGIAYEIPVARALTWLQEKRYRDEAAKRAHADDVRQYAIDFLGADAAATVEQPGLSADERLKLLQEELLSTKVRKERGDLIRKASVEEALANLLVAVRRRNESFSDRLAKRVDMSREVIAQIDEMLKQDLKALAAELGTIAEIDDAWDEGGDSAV